MKSEYNNLLLSATIKSMQIQERINEIRVSRGLGPEYLLDEQTMTFRPTEVPDSGSD